MLRQFIKQVLGKGLDIKSTTRRTICTSNALQKTKTCAQEGTPLPEDRSIIVDKDENITLIGINRPEQRNAINAPTASKLCKAFSDFEADEKSPVAVLYGVGGSFCAGYDILALGTDGEEQISVDILMSHEGSVGPTRRHIRKPVVCGINGYCVANGMELALMCDLRVVEETAVLGFFNRRFGVPVIDGGTARLPAMIGYSRALDLILTGRQICAKEAHEMGIANRIVPTGTSLHHALELAKLLAKFPQGALNHDRNSTYSAVFEADNFNQAVQNEIMYTSRDIIEQMQEGIKWFNQTFKADTSYSWVKRSKSMADWDDKEVAQAAAEKIARAEAEKKEKEEADAAEKTKDSKSGN